MNMVGGSQKFREIATFYEHISSTDGEQLRNSIVGMNFKCCEFELTRVNRMIIAEGVLNNLPTLAIITNDERAVAFEPDDKIKYRGHDYNVLYRGKIKNFATPNSVAYVLGLQ